MPKQIQEMVKECPCHICITKEPMSHHTSFRVGGEADIWVMPTAEELPQLFSYIKEQKLDWTVVGNGSNLLVSDDGIRGLVIAIGEPMSSIQITDCDIEVEAGALLSQVANLAASHGLSGMEFAAGIPGSIGGAVLMNAGAYDGQIADIIQTATWIDEDGKSHIWDKSQMNLSYRHSRFMEQRGIITKASFRLALKPQEEIYARMKELSLLRQEKQPLEYPSAGSTFKRPEGHFAGKLIMEAGLSGVCLGGARVSSKHCGFIINDNQATASEIYQLIQQVQEKVKQTSGIDLELEVRLLGEF